MNGTSTTIDPRSIDPAGTSAVIADVLRDHPDVVDALAAAHTAAWAAADRRSLELCRLRVAQLVGCDAEAGVLVGGSGVDGATAAELRNWPASDRFDDRDRAVLAWCEMFVIDVASLDDDTARAVAAHLGDAGLVDLTNAVLVIEQRQRMRCMWEHLGLVTASSTGRTDVHGDADGHGDAEQDSDGGVAT